MSYISPNASNAKIIMCTDITGSGTSAVPNLATGQVMGFYAKSINGTEGPIVDIQNLAGGTILNIKVGKVKKALVLRNCHIKPETGKDKTDMFNDYMTSMRGSWTSSGDNFYIFAKDMNDKYFYLGATTTGASQTYLYGLPSVQYDITRTITFNITFYVFTKL